jgi:hypothetical protein
MFTPAPRRQGRGLPGIFARTAQRRVSAHGRGGSQHSKLGWPDDEGVPPAVLRHLVQLGRDHFRARVAILKSSARVTAQFALQPLEILMLRSPSGVKDLPSMRWKKC